MWLSWRTAEEGESWESSYVTNYQKVTCNIIVEKNTRHVDHLGKPWGFYGFLLLCYRYQLAILDDLVHWNARSTKIGCWSRKLGLGFTVVKNMMAQVYWTTYLWGGEVGRGPKSKSLAWQPGPCRYLRFSMIFSHFGFSLNVPYNDNAWQFSFSNISSCVKIYDNSYNVIQWFISCISKYYHTWYCSSIK